MAINHAAGPCKGDGTDEDPRTGLCGFRAGDWTKFYEEQHLVAPTRPLLDMSKLSLGPPTGVAADECVGLLAKVTDRTEARRELIYQQAQSEKAAIQPVLDVLGLDYDTKPNRKASKLRREILENIWQPAFIFKQVYQRARPSRKCSAALAPMFPKGDRLYPGHPSYPSGHATMAYTWAYLLGTRLAAQHAAKKQLLLDAARAVAVNREVAGVHYESDSEAGRALGEQIANGILAMGELKDHEYKALMPGWT